MAVFFFGEEERGHDAVDGLFVELAFPKEYEGLVVVTRLVVVFGRDVTSSRWIVFEAENSISVLSARLCRYPTVSTFVVGVL